MKLTTWGPRLVKGVSPEEEPRTPSKSGGGNAGEKKGGGGTQQTLETEF